LGLKKSTRPGQGPFPALSEEEGRLLALAYLDSIQTLGTGYLVDHDYLLSFATNQFGWTLINQSSADHYLAPVVAKNEYIGGRFDRISSRVFWFVLFSGLFFLLVFLLIITGILHQFTLPIRQLANWVSENRPQQKKAKVEDEVSYLENAFTAINADLDEYIQRLEASNLELEQYAHVVAHDLRQPLRMISSYVSLLVNRNKKKFDEDSKTYAQFAIEGTKQMDSMIRHILEYASLSRKLSEAEWEEIDLNEPLQAALDGLQSLIEQSGAKLAISALPNVNCKATFIATVFQNLLENAIKYRQAEITPLISISALPLEREWQISIADNGIGIPADMQANIFNMFSRLPQNKEVEGAGIGLANVKRIIEQNGGRIWVESAGENQGSTFHFTLLKGSQHPHEKKAAAKPPQSDKHPSDIKPAPSANLE
jgi:signal transduction histidine kinase